jgi:mono/diheme cytochrome c family protein
MRLLFPPQEVQSNAIHPDPRASSLSVRASFSLLLSLALALAASACKKQLRPDELKGAALYRTHCSACHEDAPEGLLKPPPRLDHIFRQPNLPDGVPATDQAVHDVILQGLRTMPAFDGRLREEDVRFIIAYLHSKS